MSGIFRFRFYESGEWVEVVVDDYLPCTEQGDLIFGHSVDRNEFWQALIEKAYAKLRGCYQALATASPGSALVDLSGHMPEYVNLQAFAPTPDATYNEADLRDVRLYSMMKKALNERGLLSCSIAPSDQPSLKENAALLAGRGLFIGHSYAVTSVVKIKVRMSNLRRKDVKLVKLWNPWGADTDGPWSSWTSWGQEWQLVTKRELKRLKLNQGNGEIFMSFEYLINVESTGQLFVCLSQHEDMRWDVAQRYRLFLNDHARLKQNQPCDDEFYFVPFNPLHSIGFVLLRVEDNRKYRIHSVHHQIAGMVTYTNTRDIFGRFPVQPGRYVLVPTTFEPGQEGRFHIRIFGTAGPMTITPLIKDVPRCSNFPTHSGSRVNIFRSLASLWTTPYPIGVFRLEIISCSGVPTEPSGILQPLAGPTSKSFGHRLHCMVRFCDDSKKKKVLRTRQATFARCYEYGTSFESLKEKNHSHIQNQNHTGIREGDDLHCPTFNSYFMWPVRRPRGAWASVELWCRNPGTLTTTKLAGEAAISIEDYMSDDRVDRTWEVDVVLRAKPQKSNRKGWVKLREEKARKGAAGTATPSHLSASRDSGHGSSKGSKTPHGGSLRDLGSRMRNGSALILGDGDEEDDISLIDEVSDDWDSFSEQEGKGGPVGFITFRVRYERGLHSL
ncbi:Calpain-5 [Quaeritorhiza haematococci]|nr:Calpain-5 [Quaeritorhiza haematococci]